MFPSLDSSFKAKIVGGVPGTRLVVEYFFNKSVASKETPVLSMIGKFYGEAAGSGTYRHMRKLKAMLRGYQPRSLAVPSVFFYDSRRRFLVQQRVPGVSYFDLLQRSDYRKYLKLAGKALATLHSLGVQAGKKKWICQHTQDLIHPHPLELAEQLPEHRYLVYELLRRMQEQEMKWKKEILVSPVHRDFHLRQLFYGENQLWVVDWDLFAKGDPALDVGNFLVYLETHLTERCLPSVDAFLEGYVCDRATSILQRVWLYKGFTYLRLACKQFRLKEDRRRVKNLLMQSERCLMQESGAIPCGAV